MLCCDGTSCMLDMNVVCVGCWVQVCVCGTAVQYGLVTKGYLLYTSTTSAQQSLCS